MWRIRFVLDAWPSVLTNDWSSNYISNAKILMKIYDFEWKMKLQMTYLVNISSESPFQTSDLSRMVRRDTGMDGSRLTNGDPTDFRTVWFRTRFELWFWSLKLNFVFPANFEFTWHYSNIMNVRSCWHKQNICQVMVE